MSWSEREVPSMTDWHESRRGPEDAIIYLVAVLLLTGSPVAGWHFVHRHDRKIDAQVAAYRATLPNYVDSVQNFVDANYVDMSYASAQQNCAKKTGDTAVFNAAQKKLMQYDAEYKRLVAAKNNVDKQVAAYRKSLTK